MNKKNAKELIECLKKAYPDATCSLDFTTPFELVVAVMLSAQCTDERVNKTTPALFKECKKSCWSWKKKCKCYFIRSLWYCRRNRS